VRAVRANAASGREIIASPITGRSGAGGCGRDGSGMFSSSKAINDSEIERKKLGKKRPPLSRVDMNSFGSAKPTSSSGPDHVAELPDNYCPVITSRSASHSDGYSKQKGTEKVVATKNTIINIDCDDDDEIVFLGTASGLKNSSDTIKHSWTSSSNNSSNNGYTEARRHGGNNLPPIDRRSVALPNTSQDDSFPIIIIGDNNRRNIGSDWNYRNNSQSSSSTSSSRNSSQSTYDSSGNFRSDDFYENYIMHEASDFDEKRVSPPSSSFPGDQMLKIQCEICNQQVTV
jgi:hypothetical protein